MKKYKFILVILFLNYFVSIGQMPNWEWAEQSIGSWNIGLNVITDNVGNVYVCGFYEHSSMFGTQLVNGYQQTGYVVKYSNDGDFKWCIPFKVDSGINHVSFAEKVSIDNNSNLVVYGRFHGNMTVGGFTLNNNNQDYSDDFFVVKMDTLGNIIWAKKSNDIQSDYLAMVLAIDKQNNIYLAGTNSNTTTFDSLTANKRGFYIFKLNPNGIPIKLINESNCRISSINVSEDDKIYISAIVDDTTIIGNDTIIPTGFYYYNINETDTDTVYIVNSDLVFICYDSTGSVRWSKMAKSKGYDNWTYSALDENSNLYVSGEINDTTDFWGLKLNCTALDRTFILKIDSLGNSIWAKLEYPNSPNGRIRLTDIKFKSPYLYIVGSSFGSNNSFANLIIYNNSSNANYLIIILDTTGNGLVSILDSTNLNGSAPRAISVDNNENIIICGYFEDTVHFGSNYLYGNGPLMFVAKMLSLPLLIKKFTSSKTNFNFNIFPNPTNGCVEMTIPQTTNLIRILTSSGQLLQQFYVNNILSCNFSISREGLYFIQVINDEQTLTKKIVVIK